MSAENPPSMGDCAPREENRSNADPALEDAKQGRSNADPTVKDFKKDHSSADPDVEETPALDTLPHTTDHAKGPGRAASAQDHAHSNTMHEQQKPKKPKQTKRRPRTHTPSAEILVFYKGIVFDRADST